MADDNAKPLELSLVFSKSKKKKVKASNLNSNPSGAVKDEKKDKNKSKEADSQWADDDEVAATELKVASIANLPTEGQNEEGNTASQHWSFQKKDTRDLNEKDKKRFPTLEKSMTANPKIQRDEGDGALKTHKNIFGALGEDDDDDVVQSKAKGALASKKQGERAVEAAQRAKKESAKAAKERRRQQQREDGDSEESSEEDELLQDAEPKSGVSKKKTPAKKVVSRTEELIEDDLDDAAEDTKIEVDLAASRLKYADRKRLPVKDLPMSEMKAEKKAQKAVAKPVSNKNNKFLPMEDDKQKMFAPDDW